METQNLNKTVDPKALEKAQSDFEKNKPELETFLWDNRGLTFEQIQEQFLVPRMEKAVNNVTTALSKAKQNIRERETPIQQQRLEEFARLMTDHAYQSTTFPGKVAERDRYKTQLKEYSLDRDNPYAQPMAALKKSQTEALEKLTGQQQPEIPKIGFEQKQEYERRLDILNQEIKQGALAKHDELYKLYEAADQKLKEEESVYRETQKGKKMSSRTTYMMAPMSGPGMNVVLGYENDENIDLERRRNALNITKKYLGQIKDTGEISDEKLKALWQGIKQQDWLDFASFGVKSLGESFNILGIMERIEKGQQVTPEEEMAVKLYDNFNTLQGAVDKPWTYAAGQSVIQSIPFMIEIAATGGLRAGVQQTVKAAVRPLLGRRLAGVTGKVAGALATAAATPMGAVNYTQRELQSYNTEQDDYGNLYVNRYEDAPSKIGNAAIGLLQGAITTLAEASSQAVGKWANRIVSKYPKSNTAKFTGWLFGSNAVRKGGANSVDKFITQLRNSTMIGGVLPEIGEEYIEDIANIYVPQTPEERRSFENTNIQRANLGLPPISRWSHIKDLDNFLTIATSVGITQGVFGLANIPSYVNNQIITSKTNKIGEQLPQNIRQIIDNAFQLDGQKEKIEILKNAKIEELTEEQQKNAFIYIARKAEHQFLTSARQAVDDENAIQHVETIAKNISHESGEITQAIANDGTQYFVMKGSFSGGSGIVIARDAQTGAVVQLPVAEISNIESISAEQFKQQAFEEYMAEQQTVDDQQPVAPSPNADEQESEVGQTVVIDGQEYTIDRPEDENGNISLTRINEEDLPETIHLPAADVRALLSERPDAANPAEASTQNTPQVPQDAKGNYLYEQAPAEVTAQTILQQSENDVEFAVNATTAALDKAKKEAGKLVDQNGKQKFTGDMNKDRANKGKIKAAQDKVTYWQNVLNALQPAQAPAAQEQQQQQEAPEIKPSYRQRLDALRDSIETVREQILYGIATGSYKFRWNDTEGSRGLSNELGLKSESERRERIGILSNNGYTPDQLAHELWQEDSENRDTQTIRDEILDILSSVTNKTRAIEELENIKQRADYNPEAEQYEAEQQAQAEEEAIINAVLDMQNIADLENLIKLALDNGATLSELATFVTPLDFINFIEQSQYGQPTNQPQPSGDPRGNRGADQMALRQGGEAQTTATTTGSGNRPAETGNDQAADTGSTANEIPGRESNRAVSYRDFEVKPSDEELNPETELQETPNYDNLNDLDTKPWKRDWDTRQAGDTITSDSAKYKGVQINSIDRIPFSIFKPITQRFEVGIYGEVETELNEYNARIPDSSGAFKKDGKQLTYVRFKPETPLETVVKFIDDFQSGKLEGLYSEQEIREMDDTRFQSVATLETTNARWNKELDGVNTGTHNGILHLGKPLGILRSAGIKSGEITVSENTLKTKLKQHNLTTDDLQNLAQAIQEPIMVYEWGTKAKSTVIVTELTTKDGRKITVALRAENKGKKLEVTEVASIHGKAAERFLSEMENATEGGLASALRWVNKEKALDWLGLSMLSTDQGLNKNRPDYGLSTTLSPTEKYIATKIIQNFENPTIGAQISDKTFTQISKRQFNRLIDWLKKTGLAKDVVTDPAKMREVLDRVLGKDNAARFLSVWHGTPYTFDRFDRNKFLSGEGAMSYGAGFYFTDKKHIAESYAETAKNNIDYGEKIIEQNKETTDALKAGFREVFLNDYLNAYAQYSGQFTSETPKERFKRLLNERQAKARKQIIDFEDEIKDNTLFSEQADTQLSALFEAARENKWNDATYAQMRDVLQKQRDDTQKTAEAYRGNIRNAESYIKEAEILLDELDGKTNAYHFTFNTPELDKGNLLKVKIHGDKTVGELNFMRWDKPITEKQKQQVLQAVKKINFNDWRESEKFKEYVENGKLSTGIQIYSVLSNELGSDQAVSELLLNAGIDGIQYPTEYQSKGTHEQAYNYVVFDENAIEITDKIRLMATLKGEVYGFVTADGTVYLNSAKINANTPIHEFGHLWNSFVRENNPELWQRITQLTRATPYYKDLAGNPNYAHLNEQQKVDEAFAQALGDRGEQVFNGTYSRSLKDRFMKLLADFWEWVGEKLGIRQLTPEQFSNLTFEQAVNGALADITSGKPIANQIKSATDNNGNFNNNSDDIRFQISNSTEQKRQQLADATGAKPEDIARPEMPTTPAKEIQGKTKLGRAATAFAEGIVDKYQRLKNTIAEIEKRTGNKLTVAENPYIRLDKISSRAQAKIEDFFSKVLKPLLTNMATMSKKIPAYWPKATLQKYSGIAKESKFLQLFFTHSNARSIFDLYMIAKHSPYRNKYIEERTKGKTVDGSGITDKEANAVVEIFESLFTKDEINTFWEQVEKATDTSLNAWASTGRISKEAQKELKEKLKYFVPLRGWDESETDQAIDSDYLGGNSSSYSGYKQAKGRSTIAESPIAYIAQNAQSAIAFKEKNDAKHLLFNLAVKAKQYDLIRPKRVYTIETLDVNGNVTATREVIERPDNLAANERLKSTSMSEKVNLSPYQAGQHDVEVWINGEKYILELADEQVSQEINRSTDKLTQALAGSIGRVTKTMSSLMTQKNPAFVVKNTFRDTQQALFRIWALHGNTMARKFIAQLPQAIKIASMVQFADKSTDITSSDANTQKHLDYYKEYRNSGSRVGFTQMLNIDRLKKDIDAAIKNAGEVNTGNFMQKALRALAGAAAFSEDISRFAAFSAARETGKNVSEASNIAKEATVNFNRSGKYSAIPGAFYGFFNATVQAAANHAELFKKEPVKATVISAFHVALGALNYVIASSLLGGDDDDTLKNFSNYRKYVNLFIPSGGEGFIQLPISQTWRPFWALGVALGQVWNDELTPSEAIGGVAEQFGSYAPVDAVGILGGKWEEILPTSIKPIIETFGTKRNFMGIPLLSRIYDKQTEKNTPNYLRGVRTDQLPVWQKIVNAMVWGDKSSGTKYYNSSETGLPEELGGIDLSPDQLQHLILSYTGGVGTFVNDLTNLTYNLITGGKISPNKIPVSSAFYTEAKPGYYTNKYYRIKDVFDQFEQNLKTDTGTGRILEYASAPDFLELLSTKADMTVGQKQIDFSRQKELQKIFRYWDQQEKAMQQLSAAEIMGTKDKEEIRREVERISKETVQKVEPIFKELEINY